MRVPVFTAHAIAINAETELPVSPEQAREVFRQFPGLQVWDTPSENRYPMPAPSRAKTTASSAAFVRICRIRTP